MTSVIALLTAVLTGCGIRATAVPTDVGTAPSRASCTDFTTHADAEPALGITAQIYLVCTSQLVNVERTVQIPAGQADEGIRFARALLHQLQGHPSAPEREAGYTTSVLDGITVMGGRASEPRHTLRLGVPPSHLSSYALAQIVCTFADSPAAAEDGSVILGGPDSEPLLHYQCTSDLRTHPGTTTPPTTAVERTA